MILEAKFRTTIQVVITYIYIYIDDREKIPHVNGVTDSQSTVRYTLKQRKENADLTEEARMGSAPFWITWTELRSTDFVIDARSSGEASFLQNKNTHTKRALLVTRLKKRKSRLRGAINSS